MLKWFKRLFAKGQPYLRSAPREQVPVPARKHKRWTEDGTTD